MNPVWRVFLVLASLAFWGTTTKAAGLGEEPGFSFWGNLPCAQKILEYRLQERTDPVPLTDPEKLDVCGVEPGTPVTLVRNGIIQGHGVVGQVLAGWIGRAGDDRTVFFQPAGLPDSVAVSPEYVFADLRDREFDFYVLGNHEVEIVEPGIGRGLSRTQVLGLVGDAINAGVFSGLELPLVTLEDGTRQMAIPEPDGVIDWLEKREEPVHWNLWADSSEPVEVFFFPSHFLVIKGKTWSRSFFKRGKLDFFIEVGGKRYFVMRTGEAGTGAWGYLVYVLEPGANPQLVFSDGSWST